MTWPCDLCINGECSDPGCRGGRECQAALCCPSFKNEPTEEAVYEDDEVDRLLKVCKDKTDLLKDAYQNVEGLKAINKSYEIDWKVAVGRCDHLEAEMDTLAKHHLKCQADLNTVISQNQVMREVLEWINRLGGCGLHVHERIKAALGAHKPDMETT